MMEMIIDQVTWIAMEINIDEVTWIIMEININEVLIAPCDLQSVRFVIVQHGREPFGLTESRQIHQHHSRVYPCKQ
jgi:hypothetical protein